MSCYLYDEKDEWQQFENELHAIFSGTGNGNAVLPSIIDLPALPSFVPPESLESIQEMIQRSIEESFQLPNLESGSYSALSDEITPAQLEVLRNRVREAGGVDEFLASAAPQNEEDVKDIAAVEALNDLANSLEKSWEETLDIVLEGHQLPATQFDATATASSDPHTSNAGTCE